MSMSCLPVLQRRFRRENLVDPRVRDVRGAGDLRMHSMAGRREAVGVLELPGKMRAIGESRLNGDFGHRPVRIFDQPVRVPQSQLAVR